jgi:ribonuclease HI
MDGLSVSGVWTSDLQKEHINFLEMKAVLHALSHFQSHLQNKSLVLASDNTTVVAYLQNQGGTHCYKLYLLTREILLLCDHLRLHLVVRHVPGKLNVLADSLSRTLAQVNTEWELLQ